MFLVLRAWRWSSRPSEQWPKDVREYVLRRSLKRLRCTTEASLEGQIEAGKAMVFAASNIPPGDISDELRADLIEEGMRALASVPATNCRRCNKPVFVHSATMAGNQPYCDICAKQIN